MSIGDRIKKARKSVPMTQEQLAEKLEVSYQVVSQYERNLRNPKIDTLQKIASALDCDINWLRNGRTLEQRDMELREHVTQRLSDSKEVYTGSRSSGIAAKISQLKSLFDENLVIDTDYDKKTGGLSVSVYSGTGGDEYRYRTTVSGAADATEAMTAKGREIMSFLMVSADRICGFDK